jgi:cobalt-zinc-cadmium resistance protein CzcA
MIMVGKKQFLNGELDLFQYLQIVENAKRMQIFYLQDIFKYNEAVIEANYIFNN